MQLIGKTGTRGQIHQSFFIETDSIKGLILDEHKKQYIVITGRKEGEVTAEYILPNKRIATGWLVAPNAECKFSNDPMVHGFSLALVSMGKIFQLYV